MKNAESANSGKPIALALIFGVASIGLYSLLYAFEDTLIAYAKLGGWYFLVPIAIAFIVSYVHGSFTAHFWDFLGIKAKK